MTHSQEQEGGIGSTNTQIGQVIIQQGVSIEDVKTVSLDVFYENFFRGSQEAMQLVDERVERKTSEFLSKLQNEYPEGLQKSSDPEFQYSLLQLQKEYARTGETPLSDLLLDMLVDKCKEDSQSLRHLVLREALVTTPKLVKEQVAILSISFIVRYCKFNAVQSLTHLAEVLDLVLHPLLADLPDAIENPVHFEHLVYCGCGTLSIGRIEIEKIYSDSIGHVFDIGAEAEYIHSLELSKRSQQTMLIPTRDDPVRFRLKGTSIEEVEQLAVQYRLPTGDITKLTSLFKKHMMTTSTIKEALIEKRPYMERVFQLWGAGRAGSFDITSVGKAIAHSNCKRHISNLADLSIWV